MTLQRAQQQAALGVPDADGAVVGAEQQHPAGALLGRAHAAHASGAVAFKHIELLQGLRREEDEENMRKGLSLGFDQDVCLEVHSLSTLCRLCIKHVL